MGSWIARPILAALATALAHGVPLLCIPSAGASSLLSLDKSKQPDAGADELTRCKRQPAREKQLPTAQAAGHYDHGPAPGRS